MHQFYVIENNISINFVKKNLCISIQKQINLNSAQSNNFYLRKINKSTQMQKNNDVICNGKCNAGKWNVLSNNFIFMLCTLRKEKTKSNKLTYT